MVEQVTNSSPFPLDRGRVNRGSGSKSTSSSSVSGRSDEAQPVQEQAELATDIRAQFGGLAKGIDSSLQSVSRHQVFQQAGGRVADVLQGIDQLAAEFDSTPDSEIGAAQQNQFAVEQVNLRRALDGVTFDQQRMYEPSAALDVVLSTQSILNIGPSASQALDHLQNAMGESSQVLETEARGLARAQVELQNLESLNSTQVSDNISDLLVQVGQLLDLEQSSDLFDLNRQNILGILGDSTES